jgi:hypothetical protein
MSRLPGVVDDDQNALALDVTAEIQLCELPRARKVSQRCLAASFRLTS